MENASAQGQGQGGGADAALGDPALLNSILASVSGRQEERVLALRKECREGFRNASNCMGAWLGCVVRILHLRHQTLCCPCARWCSAARLQLPGVDPNDPSVREVLASLAAGQDQVPLPCPPAAHVQGQRANAGACTWLNAALEGPSLLAVA